MHPSSALNKEETEAIFSHTALLTKMDRHHIRTKGKANFCKHKENMKNYGNKIFDQSEHSSVNSNWQTKINCFRMFIGCC